MLCSERGCAATQITHSRTQSERGRLRLCDDEASGLKAEGCEVMRYVAVSFRHSGTIIVGLNNIYQKQQACGLSVVFNVVQTEINTL